MNERERHKKGMKVRPQVLGKAHVERAAARKNAFHEEFQDLITRYDWGEIWTGPGLPKKTRSLITIAMMVALNRTEELKLHLRASVNTGVSRDDIKEVLLQTAIYCGVPAANHAFHAAEEVFAEGRKLTRQTTTETSVRISLTQLTERRYKSGRKFSCRPIRRQDSANCPQVPDS